MPKRIVICADGTWNDPEKPNPTNVLRVARAIAPIARDGRPQVVFYDWGVGTYHQKVAGGAFGVGLEKNVQDGYRFIVQNYDPGDEIFLFGFSRGAYTVRCLAGMLNNCGVLQRRHAHRIRDSFAFYKSNEHPPGSEAADRRRRRYGYGSERGPVHFVGVWDTVGALGIPTRALAFVDEPDLFFDAQIGSNVRTARHAVAIDERRADFKPTLWTRNGAVDVRQVWFAGVHADVGGGYAPQDRRLLSEIPLAWMAREASRSGLTLAEHLLDEARLDPLAPANESDKGFYRLRMRRDRTIPRRAVVHRSVRERHASGAYASPALESWLERNGGWGAIEGSADAPIL
jgi:uncharacterized protein (DUF2235 family)